MKKWEEQQRKKNYSKMIRNAKSSKLGTKKVRKSKVNPIPRGSLYGEGTPPQDPAFSPSTASSLGVTVTEMGSYLNKHPNETLIFKLLQGFNL
jgi:hypothetical protein